MQIDPKVAMWVNIVISIVGFLAGASAQLTTLFGQGNAQAIVSLCGLLVGLLGAINSTLHAYSSTNPGPLAPPDSPAKGN